MEALDLIQAEMQIDTDTGLSAAASVFGLIFVFFQIHRVSIHIALLVISRIGRALSYRRRGE